MPYTLTQTNNVMAIAECQYAAAQTIQFTPFTSCIGVLAKVQGANQVIGIHLVLVDAGGNTFTAANVPLVTQALTHMQYDPATVLIIGQIAYWQNSAGPAYNALVAALAPANTYPLADGTYGATIDQDGNIELTY